MEKESLILKLEVKSESYKMQFLIRINMHKVALLTLSLFACAISNSIERVKMSGRLVNIGNSCDKYCEDSLVIIKEGKLEIVKIQMSPEFNKKAKFGDSIDIIGHTYSGNIFVDKITKYKGFDQWSPNGNYPLACWDVTLFDSIGKIIEKQLCISKNSNPNKRYGATTSSAGGAIKGARILGVGFYPKFNGTDRDAVYELQWNVGYANKPQIVIGKMMIKNGNAEISLENPEFHTIINKSTKSIDWK